MPDVVERYLACLTSHDWVTFADCLADDFVRIGPYGDTYATKSDYVAFISELMPKLPGYELAVERVTYAGRVAVAELSETVDHEGRRRRTPEALVFDLDGGGRITLIKVFVQRLGVEPRNLPQ